MRGHVDVGYEINRGTKYCLRVTTGSVIGAYNCTFNKRARFNYKVSMEIKAYTIRKQQWYKLVSNPDYADITKILIENIKNHYTKNI